MRAGGAGQIATDDERPFAGRALIFRVGRSHDVNDGDAACVGKIGDAGIDTDVKPEPVDQRRQPCERHLSGRVEQAVAGRIRGLQRRQQFAGKPAVCRRSDQCDPDVGRQRQQAGCQVDQFVLAQFLEFVAAADAETDADQESTKAADEAEVRSLSKAARSLGLGSLVDDLRAIGNGVPEIRSAIREALVKRSSAVETSVAPKQTTEKRSFDPYAQYNKR